MEKILKDYSKLAKKLALVKKKAKPVLGDWLLARLILLREKENLHMGKAPSRIGRSHVGPQATVPPAVPRNIFSRLGGLDEIYPHEQVCFCFSTLRLRLAASHGESLVRVALSGILIYTKSDYEKNVSINSVFVNTRGLQPEEIFLSVAASTWPPEA